MSWHITPPINKGNAVKIETNSAFAGIQPSVKDEKDPAEEEEVGWDRNADEDDLSPPMPFAKGD